jgi:hypothetical protein
VTLRFASQVSETVRRLRYLDRLGMRQVEIYGAVALGGLIFLFIVIRQIIG